MHRYRIAYTVRGAPLTFADHDELYWDAIGNQWPVPISNAHVTVTAPAAIIGIACFSGPQGSSLPCDRRIGAGARRATFTQRLLGAGSGVTDRRRAAEGHDPAAARSRSSRQRRTLRRTSFAVTPATVGLGGGLACSASRSWSCSRRGAAATAATRARPSTPRWATPRATRSRCRSSQRIDGPVEFIPPDGIRPGQVGTLVDEQANLLDVTASIVDLAVRGWLTITELEPETSSIAIPTTSSPRHQKGGKGTLAALRADVLLHELFNNRSSVKLSDLKYKFRESLSKIQNAMYDDAVTQGWYRIRPDQTRRSWTADRRVALVVGHRPHRGSSRRTRRSASSRSRSC